MRWDPVKLIQEENLVQAVFVNDRSFGVRTLGQCFQVLRSWKDHTGKLGRRESLAKTQITARTKAKRDQIRSSALGEYATDSLTGLGWPWE